MPQAVYDTPDVRESMVRPVALDIARQVLEWTGLPKSTQLLFGGENGEVFQPGSTITTEQTSNQFDSQTRWTMTLEERTNSDLILTASVNYVDHPRIFNDTDTRVEIRPVYVEMDWVFTFTAKFTDRNHARMWRNDIRTRVSMDRQARYHKAAYSYLIPGACIDLAREIHDLREKVAPYGETFDQYWNRYISTKATVLSDEIGKNKVWAIGETQTELIGYFDIEGESEEGQKHPDNSSWDVNFTYTVKIHVPQAVWMRYPLVVHNQMIPKMFRQTALPPRLEDTKIQYSAIADAMRHFNQTNLAVNLGVPGLAIPQYDEFIPQSSSIPLDTLRVVTVLTSIDSTNPLELMAFTDMGKYTLDADVLEFMRGEVPWLTKYRLSVMNVIVLKDEQPLPDGEYYVSPDLKVMLVNQPDYRATYHVRLSLYQRPRLLGNDAKTRMRNNCAATIVILKTLNPNVADMNPSCMIDDFMSQQVFHDLVEEVDREFDSRANKQHIGFNTVMTYFIKTQRE